jgi:hypothetical protein
MKKLLLILLLMFLGLAAAVAQSQDEMEKFIKLFYPVTYPFVASEYPSRGTDVGSGLREMDENMYKIFVQKSNIKPVALRCELEDFLYYSCYIQFPQTDSVYILVLSPEMRDPACRCGSLMVTYSKHTFKLQDTLWISVEGKLDQHYIDNQKIICGLEVESILTNDSINVTRIVSYFLRFNNVPRGEPSSKRIKTTTFHTTYKMTVGGKFIKLREKRDDEILDPIAEKLKEPEHYVR